MGETLIGAGMLISVCKHPLHSATSLKKQDGISTEKYFKEIIWTL